MPTLDAHLSFRDDALADRGQPTTPDGLVLMASDTPEGMPYAPPAGFSVAATGDDEATIAGYGDALAAGGTVTMPFETPPWGGKFGMLVDRFGIAWMLAANA